MKTTYSALRLVALLCVAMVSLASLAQPTLGLLFLFLIPFWFFLAVVVSAPFPSLRMYAFLFLFHPCLFSRLARPPVRYPSRT
jgi:hypothetical protein